MAKVILIESTSFSLITDAYSKKIVGYYIADNLNDEIGPSMR